MAIVREEWRDVVGYEGFYQVSNKGRVRKIISDGTFKILRPYRTGRKGLGHLQIGLNRGGIRLQALVHSLVAIAFIGPRPKGKQVNHKDGDKLNNDVKNLEWMTPQENTQHAFDTGLSNGLNVAGEKHGRSKLKETDVIQIREMAKVQRIPHHVIAEQFGITAGYVCQIASGIRWKHLNEVERLS